MKTSNVSLRQKGTEGTEEKQGKRGGEGLGEVEEASKMDEEREEKVGNVWLLTYYSLHTVLRILLILTYGSELWNHTKVLELKLQCPKANGENNV